MKKENLKKREKKIFEMLWTHLKESDKYKQFCIWLKEKEKNPNLAWPDGLPRSLGITFSHFGDIHTDSFEDSFKRWLENKKQRDPGIGLMEYTHQQAEYEFNSVIKEFVRANGRPPTFNEFKKIFIDRLFNHLPGGFMIRVCIPNSSNDVIAQLKELLKKKEKLPEVRSFKRQWGFVGNISEGEYEWRRDLEAYRLFKKMTLKEVIKKLGTKTQKEDCDNNNVQRDFNRYKRNARKIIESLEQGYFPRE